MKKNDKSEEISFRMLYNPYSNDDNDLTNIFQKYFNDNTAIIEIDDKIYFRALQIFILKIRKTEIIAFLDNRLELKIGDKLTDDNDNIYIVKGFAMIRFACEIPDWYTKASFVELSGDYHNTGHYFAKL